MPETPFGVVVKVSDNVDEVRFILSKTFPSFGWARWLNEEQTYTVTERAFPAIRGLHKRRCPAFSADLVYEPHENPDYDKRLVLLVRFCRVFCFCLD